MSDTPTSNMLWKCLLYCVLTHLLLGPCLGLKCLFNYLILIFRYCRSQFQLSQQNTVIESGLNDRNFLLVLKAENSKIKVLAHSVSGENFLPGVQRAAFTLCSHVAFPWCTHMKRERFLSLLFL